MPSIASARHPVPRRRPTRALAAAVVVAALVLAVLVVGLWRTAADPARTRYLPQSWVTDGTVPWAEDRSLESTDFVVLWGELSGTDPTTAAPDHRFDPAELVDQLQDVYDYYVDTVGFSPGTEIGARNKIVVLVTGTWDDSDIDTWDSAGTVEGSVGVMTLAPTAARPRSRPLAVGVAEVLQHLTVLGRGDGFGFTDASAAQFWQTSAEYLASQVYPTSGGEDLARFLRSENLAWSSARHAAGAWLLLEYLVEVSGPGGFTKLWEEALANEHPLETYRRVNGLTQQELNVRLGEYAQRQITFDLSDRFTLVQALAGVDGAQSLLQRRGTAVQAVDAAAGHYAVPDALAPSDYGYTIARLVPDERATTVLLRLKGHLDDVAGSGWSYGLVAVADGVARYGEVSTDPDGQLQLQLRSDEDELYLVVTGAPDSVHHYEGEDAWTEQYRYPFEFRVRGATPATTSTGSAPGGGHWHPNGGGWVSDLATVADTAYVGPDAAVLDGAEVTGQARVEGRAWVNAGGVVADTAVVRDNAVVQGGVVLAGSAVVGGDAEPGGTCAAGTYLRFDPERECDGGPGETDLTPTFAHFATSELAFRETSAPSAAASSQETSAPARSSSATTTTGTAGSTGTATTAPTGGDGTATGQPGATQAGGTSTDPPATTEVVVADTPTPATTATTAVPVAVTCSATSSVRTSSGGTSTVVLTVTAGSAGLRTWTVSWTPPTNYELEAVQGAVAGTSGSKLTLTSPAGADEVAAGGTVTAVLTVSGRNRGSRPSYSCSGT